MFNEGTYKLMVKDLLGHIKVTIESLKEVTWRRMKARLTL